MRHRLGERRYRGLLAVAVVALAALAGFAWWLIPVLWQMSSIVRILGISLIAVLFAGVILLIWVLHSDQADR
jgi:hypothetical protein